MFYLQNINNIYNAGITDETAPTEHFLTFVDGERPGLPNTYSCSLFSAAIKKPRNRVSLMTAAGKEAISRARGSFHALNISYLL